MGHALPDMVAALGPVHFWGALLVALLFMVTGFHSAFAHLSRARILEDMPTSLIRSASQGYVELQGISRLLDGPPIHAPLSNTACTWWEILVEERTGTGQRRWHRVRGATSHALFALEDASGRCIVDPDGAEVFPMITRRWYGDSPVPSPAQPKKRFMTGRYRYTEKRIHAGDPLYAVGKYQTRYVSDEWDPETEVAHLLREWKKDQPSLLERFDSNNDGELDLREWDAVRISAREQVLDQQRQLEAEPGLHILSVPADGRPFLLGALPQPDLARKLRKRAIGGLVSFLVGGTVVATLITLKAGL